MKKALLASAMLALLACGGGGEDKKADSAKVDAKSAAPSSSAKASKKEDKTDEKKEDKAADPKPAEEETVELSLAPFDKTLADYVMTVPKSAKIEGDDEAHRRITFGEDGFLELSIAAGWDDAVKGLANDKDNQNIKKVSDTEYRWERNPPIGRMYLVDTLVKVGDVKWSCSTGMLGPLKVEIADTVEKMCKSITKKKK
jgi:hypothetical protein